MGVDCTNYIIYGKKLAWLKEEAAREELGSSKLRDDGCIIMDGMCGDYIVIGIPISKSTPFFEDLTFTELDVSDLKAKEKHFRESFAQHHPTLTHLIDGRFKLLYFNHYY